MAISSAINKEPVSGASAAKVNMKFEVIVIPVADVDRSRAFYTKLGWRLMGREGKPLLDFNSNNTV